MTESTLTKTERISLRLDPAAKHKIEHAAALSNRSINGFILASVLEHADEIIQTSERIQLDDQDRDRFFAAILNPPEPLDSLRDAFNTHEQMAVVDRKHS